MSSTLIDSVKSVFSETLIAKFSVLLGEPEVNIQKAIHGAIPMVLTDIIQKAWSQEHTVRVWNLGKQAAAGDFFGRLHELTIDSGGLVTGSVLLNQGTDFAKSLLSPRTEAVVNEISRYASISIPASSFITGVVSFAALDAIGRYITSTNADANNLAIWLKSQAQGHVHSIPAGLEVKRALGIEHYPWEKRVAARSNTALYVVLVLIILGVGAFLLYRYRQQHMEVVAGTTDTTMSDTTGRVAASEPAAASTDTAAASAIQVTLPNGKTLDARKGGTEDRLVQFLSDPNAKLDKDHGNWFDFTQTGFASNSSSLLLDSEKQLKNIVSILNAFPKARIKIGGYSDNTGDSVANIRLSRERAEKIEVKLKDLGARPVQITGAQGYGPQYPVGDNGTATGRAMNRRMSIDVKAK
jgi:outer membrane protein OmpA-like peptidoglycan-associated protein